MDQHTTEPTGDDPTADLRRFLDASPSPWHAVAVAARTLEAAGFTEVDETGPWPDSPAGFVRRSGALVAWRAPTTAPDTATGAGAAGGFRIVGAHTDSPGLRVKPQPDTGGFGWRQLGVEVYGGVLANSWLDRDLGIAGRIVARDGTTHLVHVAEPVARVPQLAVHLDREVNERGLVLDRQAHLTPVWGTGTAREGDLARWLAGTIGVAVDDVGWWDLCLFDVTPAAVLGADRSLLASGRLDNLLSCWAAVEALASAPAGRHVGIVALFDHEEVGSESATGAAGPLLATVLERIVAAAGGDREAMARALARSVCVSADNAHAVHPNYPERHEPQHRPLVNRGPAIKVNSNQRYATDGPGAARFQALCAAAGVPCQVFVSRNNMPCGSTIGPITATRLGVPTIDVGVPQLSMHSARELCGADDPGHLRRALAAFLGEPSSATDALHHH